MKPVVFINFKTYKSGADALKLAKALADVDKNIIVGVQAADIYNIKKHTGLRVFSQHVDDLIPGRNTGFVIPESIKENGGIGTFLNHSEHPLTIEKIKESIKVCRDIGLEIAVFTKDLKEAKKIERLKPEYLIYEPPELVAGNVSVSQAKPEVIKKIVKSLKMPILVGAGIKNNDDIIKSLELGAIGIAVSSAITTAKDPKKALNELLGKRR